MKYLSIAIPCYNSADYMSKCIETLLTGGEDVEILIIDDGSKQEETRTIAKQYQEKYPTICRYIHQENKGHGGAVNTGIANATGLYFKVVDSDDWVDTDALAKILTTLKQLHESNSDVDAFISHYIYDNVERGTKYVMDYRKFLPINQVFGWDDIKPLGVSTYVLMHSIIYRTELIRDDVKLQLPEHTFYVDNIYAFEPFSKVQKMYYLDVDFYHYFIGRPGQSVDIDIMLSRAEQQYRVNKLMIEYMGKQENLHPAQEQFMAHYLTIIMTITTVLYYKANKPEVMESLWNDLNELNPELYTDIRKSLIGRAITIKGRLGKYLVLKGYEISQKTVGFQ